MSSNSHNTRIAPSPTGDMHIGTARTAIFNWLAARSSGGEFILRIDDTDEARNRQECVDVILQTMEWLGLDYDELFYQSDRRKLYQEAALSMYQAGLAEQLSNGALALKVPDDLPTSWDDRLSGTIPITETNREQIAKVILLKGRENRFSPTYQLASVVDDYCLGINHIIRGTDHISNTPKQIAIWKVLQEVMDFHRKLPIFTHVGLIFKDKKKLSKRDNAASMLYYRDNGYNPDALFNFMLRIGWGPKEDNKANSVLDRDRALKLFLEGGSMRSASSGFDAQKLEWYQKKFKNRVMEAA